MYSLKLGTGDHVGLLSRTVEVPDGSLSFRPQPGSGAIGLGLGTGENLDDLKGMSVHQFAQGQGAAMIYSLHDMHLAKLSVAPIV